jgi:hypothetical protein
LTSECWSNDFYQLLTVFKGLEHVNTNDISMSRLAATHKMHD